MVRCVLVVILFFLHRGVPSAPPTQQGCEGDRDQKKHEVANSVEHVQYRVQCRYVWFEYRANEMKVYWLGTLRCVSARGPGSRDHELTRARAKMNAMRTTDLISL